MHIEDAQNLTEVEKKRMIATLDEMGKPHVFREAHFYCTHDPEKGQAAVQFAVNGAPQGWIPINASVEKAQKLVGCASVCANSSTLLLST